MVFEERWCLVLSAGGYAPIAAGMISEVGREFGQMEREVVF